MRSRATSTDGERGHDENGGVGGVILDEQFVVVIARGVSVATPGETDDAENFGLSSRHRRWSRNEDDERNSDMDKEKGEKRAVIEGLVSATTRVLPAPPASSAVLDYAKLLFTFI
ncbi:hypothetical protein PIB30_035017 [Stylosanthes scabra]|uniref:Uncharacterized protein n=1 Tax=Stylosanthes scabra TaxID=79078 RepID=A0ABU6UDI5_9FABA|nr:hypothetical protein [Stylosanthes scabra]